MTTTESDAFDAFERDAWERNAAAYRDRFGELTGRVVDPLLDAAAVGPGVQVLDAGTGPGFVAAQAVARGAGVTGVDVSSAMVQIAAAAVPGAVFHRGTLDALPFADTSFDAAVGNFVILHVGRQEQAAAELFRVLRAGGRVALTTWDQPQRCRPLGVVLEAAVAGGAGPVPGLPDGPPFFRHADDAEFAGLLEGAGFTGVRVETVEFTAAVRPGDWWDTVLGATARTGPLVRGQDAETQRRIRAAYDELVAGYVGEDGLAHLPASVKLASGRRPD